MSTDSWNCHFDVTMDCYDGLCENLNLWFSPNQTQIYKPVVKASFLECQFLPGLTSVIQIQWGLSGVLWLGVMAGCRMLSMDVPPQNINFIWCLNGRSWNFLKIVDYPVHTRLSLIDLMIQVFAFDNIQILLMTRTAVSQTIFPILMAMSWVEENSLAMELYDQY